MTLQTLIDTLVALQATITPTTEVVICFDDYIIEIDEVRITTQEDYNVEEGLVGLFGYS